MKTVGLVTSALWTDFNNDNQLDLMVVGEWMPVTLFRNEGGKFNDITKQAHLEKTTGWWNSVNGGDFDNDGDIDYILGNLGLNSKHKAGKVQPFHIYCDDFDNTGTFDIVLGYYNKGVCYPSRGRQCSSEQMPFIKKKFPTYEAFGKATIEEVYGRTALNTALHYQAREFRSGLLKNNGDGNFEFIPFKNEAQVSPNYGSFIWDVNSDGCLDVVLVGNQYPVEVETGRYDGHYGLVMTGNCDGNFEPLPAASSGIFVDGDAKSLVAVFNAAAGSFILVSGMNDASLVVHLLPLDGQLSEPQTGTASFSTEITFNGKTRKHEIYCGAGYLSQGSKKLPSRENM